MASFVGEAEAYGLLAAAGILPPRHGLAGPSLPFAAGEAVVLKGLGEELWHKSELGAVQFLDYDPPAVAAAARAMRSRIEAAGHRWIGALVCERIDAARSHGLPAEGFASLTRHEAGWIVLFGCGGLQAEALAGVAPVLRWPVALMTPEEALAEAKGHLIGKVWFGRLRGAPALAGEESVLEFLRSLWALAAAAEAEGLCLLELNPVVPDAQGRIRPLDAVGRRAPPPPARRGPPSGFLEAVRSPRRVALAGVSMREEGVGRMILESLRRCPRLKGNLILIKPGHDLLLGYPCVPDVSALKGSPVDLLILALPAAAAAEAAGRLIAQGGGARVVALVAGGFGDGADAARLGTGLVAALARARAEGRWTPAVLGPNFLGHWVPAIGLDTSFIPAEKVPAFDPAGGSLVLLGQSGAFLLSRRSRHRRLRLALGAALGNELDVSLADYLDGLADDPACRSVAAYVEGFRPGDLAATLRAALRLRQKGITLLLHRGGRTSSGQAAAASHTGALAGEVALERAILERAGVRFSESIDAFDAALAWLAAPPGLRRGPVAILTNAGFESVSGNDALQGRLPAAALGPDAVAALSAMLDSEGLAGLVAPQLPLDLTPMASESAFLRAAEIILRTDAAILLVGAVPFTRRLHTEGAAAQGFARMLAELSRAHGKPIGVSVDAGAGYERYREAFVAEGLPVFVRLEEALLGLATLLA